MSVAQRIVGTWRAPGATMRGVLSMGPREDRAVAWLMLGCLLVFVAQWPRLARVAETEGTAMDQLVAYEFLAWLMIWPLVFYGLAGLVWLGARLLKTGIAAHQVRAVMFWGWLAAAPAGLFSGLMAGFAGPGPGTNLAGAIWLGAILWFWVVGLRTATRPA